MKRIIKDLSRGKTCHVRFIVVVVESLSNPVDLTSLDLDMAAVCLCRTTLHRHVCMYVVVVVVVVVVSGMDFPDMTGK